MQNEMSHSTPSAEEVMRKVDRESNTRVFTGWRKTMIRALLVSFAVLVLLLTLVIQTDNFVKYPVFIGSMLFIGFLMYPVSKKQSRRVDYIPIYDVILAVVSAFSFYYFAIFKDALIVRASNINTVDIIVGLIALLTAFEFCRRAVGVPILCVVGAFIIYAIYYYAVRLHYSPLLVVEAIIGNFSYNMGGGFYGTPIGVCVSFIALFIIFGGFLEKTGIGTFFVDLANSIAGYAAGGPAKVAVISSALEGMYSGSSVANTVGSGAITIPTMKRAGYKPEFAAAVEAAASTGGQIMPPIMGAAAFLMADMTGLSYSVIAISAILPAFLYFAGIFLMVHFEAKRCGLKGLPKDSIPNFFKLLLSNGYLLLPVVVLVSCMNTYSSGMSASIAIMTAMIISLFDKELLIDSFKNKTFSFMSLLRCGGFALLALGAFFLFRTAGLSMSLSVFATMVLTFVFSFFTKTAPLSADTFFASLESGAKSTIGVGIACAISGLISAVVTFTGLGAQLLTVIVPLAEKSTFLALFLTMLCCIVLGMGVPTTANYVIMASITAPILVEMGIPMLAAHMFVFYFGIVADITPPVALAAYAGSAIAGSNPLKTGVNATKLAIAAFIVPYVFAFNPALLFVDTMWYEVILIVVTAIVGMFGISVGLEGYMMCGMRFYERILSIAGGLMLVIPGLVTDAIGLAIVALVVFFQILQKKAKKKKTV
jgi:TRAP transporter 4TM/12TM fusion protein